MTQKPINTKTSIKVGIIGTGSMGKGLVYQSHLSPGIDCVAVCDINIDSCVDALKLCDLEYKTVTKLDDLENTIQKGLIGVCEDGMLLAKRHCY